MKKRLVTIILIVCSACLLWASDYRFLLGRMDFHPDIAYGLVPAYVDSGLAYDAFQFQPDDTTELNLWLGGGFLQRTLWQNALGQVMAPGNTDSIAVAPYTYDVALALWKLGFKQGFGHSQLTGKDLFWISLDYDGRFEANLPAFNPTVRIPGEVRTDFFAAVTDGVAYPDLAGNHLFLSTALSFTAGFDLMVDQQVTQYGLAGDVKLSYAPRFLNGALGGQSDYVSVVANLVGAYPLYHLTGDDGLNVLSLTLVDRLRVSFTGGADVPVFVQGQNSLGSLVRGFTWATYNTSFTAVNNLDIRLAAPEPFWDGVFPRLNFFFDAGLHAGKHFNSTSDSNGLLASTGVQLTLCLWDYLDFGYYLAYLVNGIAYREETVSAGTRVVSGVLFYLAF